MFGPQAKKGVANNELARSLLVINLVADFM